MKKEGDGKSLGKRKDVYAMEDENVGKSFRKGKDGERGSREAS